MDAVALRVAGDADGPERVRQRAERLQQAQRVGERADRLGGVAADHERGVHARLAHAGDDVGKVCLVAHQSGRQVRRGGVAVPGQPPGQLERGVQAPALRRRHGQRHVPGHVREHLLLGAARTAGSRS